MAFGEGQRRVVPASSQVVAVVVMRGTAEPARDGRPAVDVLEDHVRLFEVGLVVVRPEERRSPVVHAVDEEVLQHDPPVAPDHPPVVDDALILVADAFVPLRRGRRRPAGDAAAEQQGRVEPGIDQAGEEPHPSEAGRRLEVRSIRATVPAGKLDAVQRLRDEPQVPFLARHRSLAASRSRVSSPAGTITGRLPPARRAGRTPRHTTRQPSERSARRP